MSMTPVLTSEYRAVSSPFKPVKLWMGDLNTY